MAANLLNDTNSAGSSLDDLDAYRTRNASATNNTATEKFNQRMNSIDADKDKQLLTSHVNQNEIKCDSIVENNTMLLTEEIAINERNNHNNHNLNNKFNNVNSNRKAGGYLIAVHRKLSRQDTYFLSYHKTRPSLFGVPLLIPCYEDGTNKDLYCAVWIQVARLLSPLPSTPPDQSNHATDWSVKNLLTFKR